MKFRTKILQSGKTATGIHVPDKVVASLGESKRPAVRVTLNGYTYRSTIAVMGGKFMVGVSADVRKNAGVAGGDELDVDIALDNAPREVPLPIEVKKYLDRDSKAKRFFEGLSHTNKQRIVSPIDAAKTAETRERRLEKALSVLREGKI